MAQFMYNYPDSGVVLPQQLSSRDPLSPANNPGIGRNSARTFFSMVTPHGGQSPAPSSHFESKTRFEKWKTSQNANPPQKPQKPLKHEQICKMRVFWVSRVLPQQLFTMFPLVPAKTVFFARKQSILIF